MSLWTEASDAYLAAAVQRGEPPEAIALAVGRSIHAVRCRQVKVGAFYDRALVIKRQTDARTKSLSELFEARYIPEPMSGCWLWTGYADPHGYGQLRKDGRLIAATHISLEFFGRPRPDALHFACHHCDTPPCVNPAHLFWGTHRDNVADAMRKGRMNLTGLALGRRANTPEAQIKGERHPFSKLTEDQVRAIRSDARGCQRLAREYGVTPTTIKAIRKRKMWKHVA